MDAPTSAVSLPLLLATLKFPGLTEAPGLWAVPVVIMAFGLSGALTALWWMRRDGSPFVKIALDAVRVFTADPHLRLLPVFVGAACVLAAAVAAQTFILMPGVFPLFAVTSRLGDWTRFETPLLLACALGAQVGGLAIAASNAVLADAFIERCHGRPALFAAAAARVIRRLPRLLGFTFLWWGLLAMAVIVKLKLSGLLAGRGWRLAALAVEFAGFALETGLVMAANLMLVVMLREDLGPIEAMARTLQIVRRESSSTLGELARLKLLDESMKVVIFGASGIGQILALVVGFHLHTQGALSLGGLMVLVMIGAMVPGFLVGAGYYIIIQTLQLLLASAVFLFVHDGILAAGFSREDFENVLCLKVSVLPPGVTAGPR